MSGAQSLEGALKRLDAALAASKDARLLRLRAECLEKLGRMEEAIAALDEAVALDPQDAAAHELRGHCLFHRKSYEAAAEAFTRGLAASPRSAALLRRRAKAYWLGGFAAEAAKDLALCRKLQPGAANDFPTLRLEVAVGAPAAEKRVKTLGKSAEPQGRAGAAYLQGALNFRAGRYAKAAQDFDAAEAAAGRGQFPDRFSGAGYGAMAKGFQFMSKKKKTLEAGKKGGLILTGLGLDYPYQSTLEVLKALSECDIVVNNLAGAEAMEFLGLFCGDVRTISFEGEQAKTWADKIFDWIKPGKKVAFVTRGHPLVSGHLALELLTRARRLGVEARCYSAISSVDQLLSLSQEVLGETCWGIQAFDSTLLISGQVVPQPGVPLLAYLSLPAGTKDHGAQAAGLCAALARRYEAGQRVLVYGPRYDERQLRETTLGGLEEFLRQTQPGMYSSLILLLPPARPLTPQR